MESTVVVEVARSVNDELIEAVARLMPQLSRSAPLPTRDALQEIVAGQSTVLILARQKARIVGMLTLAVFRIPTGIRAWIEDVVVDATARGHGVGEALNRHAISIALTRGARTVELSSRPSRDAANRLYRRIGFELRETNVYRYTPRGNN